jgi:hypothetical protein
MQTRTSRRRLAALPLLLALLALALAPLSASARAAAPVLSASSAGDYVVTNGTTCADLQLFNVDDRTVPLITIDPTVFSASGASPEDALLFGAFVGTSMGQRVFQIELSATVIVNGNYASYFWSGYAALKCLSGGAMQFSFKPDFDSYFMSPVGVMRNTGCGDLGGNARLVATINPTTGAFSFDVYAPVTVHPHALNDCVFL